MKVLIYVLYVKQFSKTLKVTKKQKYFTSNFCKQKSFLLTHAPIKNWTYKIKNK